MRNFRTAAVAAATALTVGLAGTSIASAQDTTETEAQDTSLSSTLSSAATSEDGSSLSGIGYEQEAWQYDDEGNPVVEDENLAYGTDMFGENQAEGPAWAENWKDGTIVAIIGSVLGAIVGAINWAKYTGILPR